MTGQVLKVAGTSVLVVGAAALVVTLGPTVRAQVRSSQRPLTEIGSQFFGGSRVGARMRDVDSADVSREKLASATGAVVEDVEAGSPADKAGFRAGDIVTSFDGEKIRSARQLSRLIEETPDGRQVAVSVLRGGAPTALKVTPEASASGSPFEGFSAQLFGLPEFRSFTTRPRPGSPSLDPFPNLETQEASQGRLGVEVMNLNDQLGDYFGTRMGVLVTHVSDGRPAKTAGLKAGDVIMRVNGQLIPDGDDLRRRVAQAGQDVTLGVMRDRKELTLKVTLDADASAPKRIVK
jgi:serine protease Do